MTVRFASFAEFLLTIAAEPDDQTLSGLLVTDLRQRWNIGQRLTVEDYLLGIPALQQKRQVLLDLVYAEWLLRDRFGPQPTREEYQQRFPTLADTLPQLLEMLAALCQSSVATLAPASSDPGPSSACIPLPRDELVTLAPTTGTVSGSGPSLPGYRIMGELGRGAMGVVYKARHLGLNRIVALKMVLAGVHAGSEERVRFLSKAEAVATLQHANVVQVYDVGHHEDLPYMALEYVNGGSLHDRLRAGLPRPGEAAWLVEQLAHGMAAAHAKGIIHRDRKPQNVLLSVPEGQAPERTALTRCTPKVTDFGLAKKVEGGSGLTQTGVIMGAPSYMAPEQAGGQGNRVGPPADIYSLGALLYELLTGRPPFQGPSQLDTLMLVVAEEPAAVRQLQPKVPRDLETICHKCLQKDPQRRYASAEALAADLRRFQEDRPIEARPVSQLERGWRWCKRNRVVASLLALVLMTLLGGAGTATVFGIRAEQQRQEAEEARQAEAKLAEAERQAVQQAQEARQVVEKQLIDQCVYSGLSAAEQQQQAQALLWFTHAVQLAERDPQRQRLNRVRIHNWNRHVFMPVAAFHCTGFRANQDRFRVFDPHPAGEHLLTLTSNQEWGIWDLRQGGRRDFPDAPGKLASAAWSPDGTLLALGTLEGQVELRAFPSGQILRRLPGVGAITALAFSSEGRLLAWGGTSDVRVWDCREQRQATPDLPHPAAVMSIRFNFRGDRLVTACADRQARVFGVTGEGGVEPLYPAVLHDGADNQVAPQFLDRDRGLLTIVGGRDAIWREANTGKILHEIPANSDYPISVAEISSTGNHLVLVWHQGSQLWDIPAHKCIGRRDATPEGMFDASFSSEGWLLATGGGDSAVQFWAGDQFFAAEKPSMQFHRRHYPLQHTNRVVRVRFLPQGDFLVTAQGDGLIRLWRMPMGDPLSYTLATGGGARLALSPDGRLLLPAAHNSRMSTMLETRVRQAATGQPAGPPLVSGGILTDALFSPDGRRAALACSTARTREERNWILFLPDGRAGNVQIWDWKTGQRLFDPVPMPSEPRGLAYSPDGTLLAVVCADGWVVLVDPETGQVRRQIDTGVRSFPENANLWVANGLARFSPDGKLLATWEMAGLVHVWEPSTGKERFRLTHANRVEEAQFSADSRFLVTASWDNQARVWDMQTGKLVEPTMNHPTAVRGLQLEMKGQHLVTIGEEGMVRRWDWRQGRLLAGWRSGLSILHAFDMAEDQRILVGGAIEGGCVVLNADSGDPLAPGLFFRSGAFSIRIAPKVGRFAASGFEKALPVFDLADLTTPSPEPVAKLRLRAELAAGQRVLETGRLVPLSRDEWEERWRTWRHDYPKEVEWHSAIAEEAERPSPRIMLEDSLEDFQTENPVRTEIRGAEDAPGEGILLDGIGSRVEYAIADWPADEYTLALWVKVEELPGNRYGQVWSGWHSMADDPLRLVIEKGQLFARIEAGSYEAGLYFSTSGTQVEVGRWQHVAAVKKGSLLSLYVDGMLRGTAHVPPAVHSLSKQFAVGGNPVLDNESVRARFARVSLQDKALGAEAIARLAAAKPRRVVPPPPVPLALAGLKAVPFSAVKITDAFWSPRLEANRKTTIAATLNQCEITGRIKNFAIAGNLEKGKHVDRFAGDSDVYKVLEGLAYTLAGQRDPELEKRADAIIDQIAAAQQPDGYLNTFYTSVMPEERWKGLAQSHELYCAGHLFEAAVAYHQATSKRKLLDVARKLADHLAATFGPDRRQETSGHEEVELALVKLYRATGEKKYLDLARFFLDMRGRADKLKPFGELTQDHKPVRDQVEVAGHAVRATYLYCGMADLAAETGDTSLVTSLERIWKDMVQRHMYVTGGIGSSAHNEGFTVPYDLPNDSAYAETCAAIGLALWNQRMFLLTGDGKYVDVLERVAYNGLLSGVSLTGDRFFYVNPLGSTGGHHRQPWFDVPCCPTNLERYLPAMGERVYAAKDNSIWTMLYAGSQATVSLKDGKVKLTQETRYPWDGEVRITVEPEKSFAFALHLRIPGWYRSGAAVSVNGQALPDWKAERGYVAIQRTWKAGDVVRLSLPLPIERVHADPRVKADAGRVALQRGPMVYCLEGVDNDFPVCNLCMPKDAKVTAKFEKDLLGGVAVLHGEGLAVSTSEDGKMATRPVQFQAIPYWTWDNRQPGPMVVWLPESPEPPHPDGVLARGVRIHASQVNPTDTLTELNDTTVPDASNDHSIRRMTWWDHLGTREWVSYRYPSPRPFSECSVYWFDDTGTGRCRVPASWRLLWRDGKEWKPVKLAVESKYGTELNQFNKVTFLPVTTSEVRLEVNLRDDFSGGILKWSVPEGK